MTRFLRAAAEYGLTLYVLVSLNFLLPRIMPGDPFTFLSSEAGQIAFTYSDDQITRFKAYYGLDRPPAVQYAAYLKDLCRGYLGYSICYGEDVLPLLLRRLPWTLGLLGASLAAASAAGVLLGSWSAWRRGRRLDDVQFSLFVLLAELPPFLVGILFLFVFGAGLAWFPLSGGSTVFAVYESQAARAVDILRHAALPVLTLTTARLGEYYLLARSAMISVLPRDFMRTARAKGLSPARIVFRHGLAVASPPVLTRFFLGLGTAAGGAVVVEVLFDYPGIGRLLRDAVLVRDYPVVQGIFLVIAVLVLSANRLADGIVRKLDPRLR